MPIGLVYTGIVDQYGASTDLIFALVSQPCTATAPIGFLYTGILDQYGAGTGSISLYWHRTTSSIVIEWPRDHVVAPTRFLYWNL
jgi:hypothetical protein